MLFVSGGSALTSTETLAPPKFTFTVANLPNAGYVAIISNLNVYIANASYVSANTYTYQNASALLGDSTTLYATPVDGTKTYPLYYYTNVLMTGAPWTYGQIYTATITLSTNTIIAS